MDKKGIDTITSHLTDELFALSMLHEMLATNAEDPERMVAMCQKAVERCVGLTSRMAKHGAEAMRLTVAPEEMRRAS